MLIAIRCRPDRKLTLPDAREVPPHDSAQGIEVLRDLFIGRRLADGDIEIVPQPEPAPPATKRGKEV